VSQVNFLGGKGLVAQGTERHHRGGDIAIQVEIDQRLFNGWRIGHGKTGPFTLHCKFEGKKAEGKPAEVSGEGQGLASGGCAHQGVTVQAIALWHEGFTQFQTYQGIIGQLEYIAIKRQFLLEGHASVRIFQLGLQDARAPQAFLPVDAQAFYYLQDR
jgi:hypothetical protein